MKIAKRWVIAAFLIGLPAIPVKAQMGRSFQPHFSGVWNPIVGSGAAYEIDNKDKGDKTAMEIAIVGKESVGGKDTYWYEMSMDQTRAGGQMIIKTLMVTGADGVQASRIIMQMPNRPPMEMPAQMVHQGHSQPTDVRSDAEDLGSETITVPAGTFVCEHYRSKNDAGDTWVSQKVSPYGMVKHESKNTTMVLTKVITDAKDKITGTPVPFNPQAFMQQQ
jgi:hypothetical protein